MKVKLVPIQEHRDFAKLAKTYAYDHKAKQFPARLPNRQPNPLAGVTRHPVVTTK